MDLKAKIQTAARDLGFDLCGVTSAAPPTHAGAFEKWIAEGNHGEMGYLARRIERRVDLQNILPGVKSVVVAGMSYHSGAEEPAAAPHTGLVARYARGPDYHEIIGSKLEALSQTLRRMGGADAQVKWYTDTGPVLERDLAHRAGIGWVGKHTNLINQRLGNWFLLGEILTTLDLEPDPPAREFCGTCVRCITACPTQAIRAPYHLDARRCISYLTIELKGPIPVDLRPLIGNRIFGCDDCLAVCPWNRFAQTSRALKQDRDDLTHPDLIEWMSLTDVQFKDRFRGTPIERSKRRGLLRNVAVALGNAGDRRAVPVLQKAVHDPEPLIREHASWALDRLA